ncbi:E3 ubiquitin-protein ligase UPL5 [Raphanus sativus]|uniref:HECT-type E3 ubiquitin transferase n=1 Tax=Raphanus sativus TaxID=3726 RepID=A0A6J0MWU9_RAPSA|nr:E3 ubiquitin-protein ligase UPL5-like [Raphanus sativus]KAJ4905755.1 E3 ubiquitin-protein ligase UPL5 [Raphanus sativus]
MTLSRFSDNHHKRKFDDNGVVDNNILQKMKRHELDADHTSPSQQPFPPWRSDENSASNRSSSQSSSSSSTESPTRSESTRLQLFVRMMSGGKTIVIHADKNDTVETLHNRIEFKTKIPVSEQRVIYKGRQLQDDRPLSYYSIEQDSSLHLVGRMRSTEHPVACQVVDDIMYIVSRMLRGDNNNSPPLPRGMSINEKLSSFFSTIPGESEESSSTENYLNIFTSSSVPAALVMLYVSPLEANRICGESSVKLFLNSCLALPDELQSCCLPVVLEFCRLLRRVCPHNGLYGSCRNALGTLLETVQETVDKSEAGFTSLHYRLLSVGEEILPCLSELADLMEQQLVDDSLGPSLYDVQKFSSFWKPLRYAIDFQLSSLIPIALPLRSTVLEAEVGRVRQIFGRLLTTMNICLLRIESSLGRREAMALKWGQYLAVLKIVSSMSELYLGGKEQVVSLINSMKVPFCALILKFVKRGDDHGWISEYKEATTFECRRHLALMLFPDGKEDYTEMHEMLIDRSDLLKEAFEYISKASPGGLLGGLFMEFKNEEATGPGVLREWFYLVCQEIFTPGRTLFLRSADDFRRFSPNPASKVDPLHLDYFKFTGRVVALALMHNVQVGVLFDRVFYLQLTNQTISLEDIKDTDRIMYNSCKQILEMDPVFFDSNAGLGLTFVLETEELGKRETEELKQDGKYTAVNSENRDEYVELLINKRFVTSVSELVEKFSEGFFDILSVPVQSFFRHLHLEDFDGMLRGGENQISVDDWKAHTEYNGFRETDRQIDWFWKILRKMTEEERRSVLFFWTSNKFIPVEGFRGLSSKLYIYRLHEANDRLPTSHTCFYRLCLPKYPTMGLMEQRLRFITQDHVSSSFGKW